MAVEVMAETVGAMTETAGLAAKSDHAVACWQ
jgi:hypothetical protein